MSTTSTHASHAAEKLAGRACQIITALSMTAGRGVACPREPSPG